MPTPSTSAPDNRDPAGYPTLLGKCAIAPKPDPLTFAPERGSSTHCGHSLSLTATTVECGHLAVRTLPRPTVTCCCALLNSSTTRTSPTGSERESRQRRGSAVYSR